MSASREKKQRRDSDASMLSPRAQEEQQKAARRKRNTIVYTIVGVIAVILVAALLVWDSGVVQRHRTAATIDGQKVSPAELMYYYYSNNVFYYAQMGLGSFSTSESPKEQTVTEDDCTMLGIDADYVGVTYHEYFLDEALDNLRRQYAVLSAAKEAGYTLSDTGKESVQSALKSLDSSRESYLSTYGVNLSRTTYLQQIYGDMMTESAYRTILEHEQLVQEYSAIAIDSLTACSDEEIDAYYQEHAGTLDTVSYYWRSFDGTAPSTTDEDGNTVEATEEEQEAALAAAKEEAEEALAEVEEDPDLVKDSDDYTLASGVLDNPESFYYEWLTDPARKPGDAKIFEGSYNSYYLAVFDERYLDETPTVDVRHILIQATAVDDPETEDVDESTLDPSDEAYEEAKVKAEEILAEWQNGAATEESFAALATEYSADTGSVAVGGMYQNVADGDMIANFNDWIFDSARQPGDVSEPIQNTESVSVKGWHLIYFIGQDDPLWKVTARQALWAENLKTTMTVDLKDWTDSLFA